MFSLVDTQLVISYVGFLAGLSFLELPSKQDAPTLLSLMQHPGFSLASRGSALQLPGCCGPLHSTVAPFHWQTACKASPPFLLIRYL